MVFCSFSSSKEKMYGQKFSREDCIETFNFYVAQYLNICPGKGWKSLKKGASDKTLALNCSESLS